MSKAILLFAAVAALAPEGEDFKPEAVNEGVWLTEAHLISIEGALAGNAAAAQTAADALATAIAVQGTAEATLATATEAAAAQATRIAELEGQVATLNKKPAAAMQATTTATDAPPVAGTDANAKYRTSFDDEAAKYK